MNDIIIDIRKELQECSDEKTRASSQHFFKEQVKVYGLKNALVYSIGKEFYKLIKNKTEIFDLCEELWQSGYLEESFIACNWSYHIHKNYEQSDFIIFEKWVNHYVNNWASCDTFCNHSVGAFIEIFPEYLTELKRWAKSDNRWMRRASAVSLIVPAKKGKFLEDIFEIADILLLDQDDMVQKGYGWMLKVASQAHQTEVFDYIMLKKTILPRTALRYAIEKMPEELRKTAMKK